MHPNPTTYDPEPPTLPEGFLLGIADSDLQVIGEDHCLEKEGSQRTMWYRFAEQSGRVFQDATPGVGVDRYHRWEEDAELIAHLGFRHYRTSLSWSRILTEEGEINAKAVAWYRRYFEALRAKGIKVYATLYHWELPDYLSQRGGWKNRATAEAFVQHAEACTRELGDLVEEIFILNEPWCAAHNSYFHGTHAPGEGNLRDTLIASHHLLLAQAMAFERIKEIAPSLPVGTVLNVEPSFPATDENKDFTAARLADQFFNGWFLDPIYRGQYPEELADRYGAKMPDFSSEDMSRIQIGASLSTMGLNYYTSKNVQGCDFSPLGYIPAREIDEEINGLGWSVFVPPVYPPGLQLGLIDFHRRYEKDGMNRIMITENGFAGHGTRDGSIEPLDDPRRIRYHQEHLKQILAAREAGVPVEGYFAWTLLDNYEWAEGYRPESCFGLVHVDRQSLARTLKASAKWFQRLNQAT
ncbi:MAG: family 1 glycosylhydrolase [Verrucomicrobiota bacterium JB023]|nr:family 1 glycosylhydrolase [Verrucomicrobiota bacterium JB023]